MTLSQEIRIKSLELAMVALGSGKNTEDYLTCSSEFEKYIYNAPKAAASIKEIPSYGS